MTTENLNGADTPKTDANGFLETPAPVVDAQSVEAGIPAPSVETSGPKKRGRKSNAERAAMAAEQIEAGSEAPKSAAGAKARTRKASYSEADIGTMAQQLVGLHKMASMIAGLPELEIRPQEGHMLASAIVNVSKEYDLAIDGKTGALIQILGAAAIIYVPRVAAISQRAKAQRNARNVSSGLESPTH